MDIKDQIEDLRNKINFHNNKYYNEDSPEISDREYDELYQQLKELESKNPKFKVDDSPTEQVGGIAKREAGILVKHNVPMLSLQDVFTKEGAIEFVERIKRDRKDSAFIVERKIDGLSISLRYRDGKLEQAVTRGDGITQGEDVTANIHMIKDVKAQLKTPVPYIELRGEVYMKHQDFMAVNVEMEKQGGKVFANPRNCAAGTLRQLDPTVVKERGLSLFVFNVQESEGISFREHSESLEWLKSQGIKVIEDYAKCYTAEEVWENIEKIYDSRGRLDYDIDGAVIKINNLEDREYFGSTAKSPRWAMAYKYPPEEKETIIRDIRLTVGRSGRITPTAIFDPIGLGGTMVERATLHNQDRIDELDIRMGDTIIVRKAGEIIPEVLSVVKNKRQDGSQPFKIADHCPVCGAETVKEENSADTVCTGLNCPAQLGQHIMNFAGRNAMNIKGFGEAYIETLISQGYLKDIADIYYLKDYRDELIEKGLIGKEKNTDKLLNIIELSKQNDIDRLITGFGIRNIGRQAASSLKNEFDSIYDLMEADFEKLIKIEDIGDISANSILNFFNNEDNLDTIKKLEDVGVNLISQETESTGEKLLDLSFVITGTLPTMSRKEMEELVKSQGAKVVGSVSKKTDYLIAGENAGSKLKRAVELEIPVLTEEEILDRLK